jgi:hypothetical protein
MVEAYKSLRKMLETYRNRLRVSQDHAGGLHFNTPKNPQKPGVPMYFGGVEIRKNYVSFYLMGVYVEPALLNGISAGLKQRMQGKSCFNFTEDNPLLFSELEQLTNRTLAMFEERGYI